MNSKFCKTKYIDIKINAHNKTNKIHKKNKVYILVGHNCIRDVCVVVIRKSKTCKKHKNLVIRNNTSCRKKFRFHVVEESTM
jgi:hypothetical protein